MTRGLGTLVRAIAWSGAFALAGGLVHCSSKSEPKGPCDGAADRAACLTAHYLSGYQPIAIALCDSASKQKIDDSKNVSLVLGSDIEDIEAQTSGQRLQRYYDLYGLHFVIRDAPAKVGFNYVLSGSADTMKERAKQAGIDLTKPPATDEDMTTIETIVGDVLGKNIRDVIASRGPASHDRIDVVIVDNIVDPAVQDLVEPEGVVLGLGMAPDLFRKFLQQDPKADYFAFYKLPNDFTPTLFIGQDDVRRFTPVTADQVIAHEFGHTMGLVHVADPNNLMYPAAGAVPCMPGLNDDQVTELRHSVNNGLFTPDAGVTTSAWTWGALGVPATATRAANRTGAAELPTFARIVKSVARKLRESAVAPASL